MTIVSYETRQQIETVIFSYCQLYDAGDFDTFAALFEHGQFFVADEPGAAAARAWIDQGVVLYDGVPLTRHEITNLIVEPGESSDEALFRSYITISQHLPGEPVRLLVQARFAGSFRRRSDGKWWWHTQQVTPQYVGDLSAHAKGEVPTD